MSKTTLPHTESACTRRNRAARHAWLAGCLALAVAAGTAPAEPPAPRDLQADSWVATDALGRTLPDANQAGPPRPAKYVGIFYFLWLGQHGTSGPFDITTILAGNPAKAAWGPPGTFHHWGRPEMGYYLSDDEYVIRKHAQLLSAAGIDTLIFDATNAVTYSHVYTKVAEVYRRMRSEGSRTPQFLFITHSRGAKTVRKLYDDLYAKGLYKELWFRWKDKPLLLAAGEGLDAEVRGFFTLRESWAWTKNAGWFGDGKDKWPWLDHYPQQPGWHVKGRPEEIAVCVAEHPTTTIGRSFHDGKQPPPDQWRTERGLYFAEQWKRALEVDPEFIFITGWNEWVAQRFIADAPRPMAGTTVPKGGSFFVDQYSQEFSRDIEPMAGGHGDNYYYQMAANIRRFKGVRPAPNPSAPKTIRIDGAFDDWRDVGPEFRDDVNDEARRDHDGWGSAGRFRDTTGQNDFVTMKVANDADYVYFYAMTRKAISPETDPNWMLLLLDTDGNGRNGWEGYDFIVNRRVLNKQQTTLERLTTDNKPQSVAQAAYAASGNELELRLPRSALGLAGDRPLRLDFHWVDNIQKPWDIVEFALHGDSAPEHRFNYRYERR